MLAARLRVPAPGMGDFTFPKNKEDGRLSEPAPSPGTPTGAFQRRSTPRDWRAFARLFARPRNAREQRVSNGWRFTPRTDTCCIVFTRRYRISVATNMAA